MTAFRKFTDEDLTIIFLSNGYKYFHVEEKVVDHIAGIIDEKLIDKKAWAEEEITNAFFKNDYTKAIQTYHALKSKNPTLNFEDTLLNIAYTLMNSDRLNESIKVFELNVKENPASFNAFDSLAEGYFNNKQFELSKENYEKSLELNPKNENAKEMLLKINNLIKK
ncbi:tetratricopeptide repeat protein [Chryseobacterium sp. MYb328]|uniref:tetratricopeptide repeat protein n=1 Tax=Chryseobacterium sp. MYb328 TaxID=2745231 RepID=UPI00309624FE